MKLTTAQAERASTSKHSDYYINKASILTHSDYYIIKSKTRLKKTEAESKELIDWSCVGKESSHRADTGGFVKVRWMHTLYEIHLGVTQKHINDSE